MKFHFCILSKKKSCVTELISHFLHNHTLLGKELIKFQTKPITSKKTSSVDKKSGKEDGER